VDGGSEVEGASVAAALVVVAIAEAGADEADGIEIHRRSIRG
jgi:hypothetical protein